MTMTSKVSLLLLALTLQSCLPLPVTYWAPTIEKAQDTNVKTSTVGHYHGGVAPSNTVEISIQKVTLFIKPNNIQISIPKGYDVHFKSSSVVVSSPNESNSSYANLGLAKLWNYKEQKYSSLDPTKPINDFSRVNTKSDKTRSFSIRISYQLKDKFSLKLPNIIINNKEYNLPIINFEKSNGFGVFPING